MDDIIKTKAQLIAELEELRKRSAENEYSSIIQTTLDGFWMVDTSGRFVEVNDAYCTMIGYSRDELLGMGIPDVEIVESPEETKQRILRIVESGYERFESRHRCKDGSIIKVEISTSYNKESHRFVVFVREITDRKRAEEKIHQSKILLESSIESSGDMIILSLDREYRYLYFNKIHAESMSNVYGTRPQIGDCIFDHMKGKDDIEKLKAHYDRAMAGEGHVAIEEYGEDQSRYYYEIRYNPIYDEKNEIIGVTAFAQNITERKRAEKSLQEHEFLLDESQRVANIGSYKADFTLGIWKSSKTLDDIFGIDKNYDRSIEGWLQIVHSDSRNELNKYLTDYVITKQQKFDKEYRIVRFSDKEERWVHGIGEVEFDEKGNITLMIGTIQDITERKREEEARERLTSAIEQSSETIVITDSEGTIQYINPAFEKITGYTHNEAIGLNPRILKSGQHDSAFYKEMWETLTAGETWNGRLVNKKKDGTLYTEEATISPVRDATGKTINYVAVKRDITENIKLEERYRQAQKVESIGRLAGGMAHDLNNLLVPIIGYAEMLIDDFDPDDERKESAKEIMRAGFRARDLVQQLLAFSRKQLLEYKTLDMNKIIKEFEKLLRRTIREDIEIEIIPSHDIQTIRADIGQIEQVIMNLSVNAQDAMPEGGTLTMETAMVKLDEGYTATHPGTEQGEYVMLAVSDTGSGMDKETRLQIFEPFYSTKGELGTGLGLATVYGIVKQHGGNIWVYSEIGEGTTFKIYLPVSEKEHIGKSAWEESGGDLRGFETILLAEDDDQVRHLASAILKKQGYTVLVAENGDEALTTLESHNLPVHLLLTDVIMPGMNGRDLYNKAADKQPDMKVLYMSGYTDNVVAHHGVLDEGVPFIQKPFSLQSLAAKVREVLDKE